MKTLSELVLLFAVLVLGVAGCKSGGGSDSGPPPPIPVPTPSLDLVAGAPIIVGSSASVKLSWTTANVSSCSASGASGWEWEESFTVNNSNYTLPGLNVGTTYTLNLTCMDLGGGVVSASVVVVVPIPQPAAVSTECSAGYSISRNPQGFTRVGMCTLSAKKELSTKGLKLMVGGFLAPYVKEVKVKGTPEGLTLKELAVATVANGQVVLDFSTPTRSYEFVAGGVENMISTYVYTHFSSIVIEASFSAMPPFGVSDSPRDVVFTIAEEKDITMEGNVVFTTPFPVEVGSVNIATGTAFFAKDFSDIVRRNMETGEEVAVTHSQEDKAREVFLAHNNTKVLFTGSGGGIVKAGVVDVDGAGCTADDLAGVLPLSSGCNKGYQVTGSGNCKSNPVLSPAGDYIVCMGSIATETGMLRMDVAQQSIGLAKDDGFSYKSLVVSPDLAMLYFTACSPKCGVYKRGFDWLTGGFGPIQVVIVSQDWDVVDDMFNTNLGVSLSPDGKKIAFGYTTPVEMYSGIMWLYKKPLIATVNTDVTGFVKIGEGREPQWISNEKLLFSGSFMVFGGSNPPLHMTMDFDGKNRKIVGEDVGTTFPRSFTSLAIIP